jgi:hypothetical protein
MSFYKKIRNIAFLIEPEKAHKLAISALKTGIHIPSNNNSELLKQEVFGLTFNNPIEERQDLIKMLKYQMK